MEETHLSHCNQVQGMKVRYPNHRMLVRNLRKVLEQELLFLVKWRHYKDNRGLCMQVLHLNKLVLELCKKVTIHKLRIPIVKIHIAQLGGMIITQMRNKTRALCTNIIATWMLQGHRISTMKLQQHKSRGLIP